MNVVKKIGAATAAAALSASAFADLPAGVTTGITTAQTDGLVVVGALAAAGSALWLIHKILRKFGVTL